MAGLLKIWGKFNYVSDVERMLELAQVTKFTKFIKYLLPSLARFGFSNSQNMAPALKAKEQCAGTVLLYAFSPTGRRPGAWLLNRTVILMST